MSAPEEVADRCTVLIAAARRITVKVGSSLLVEAGRNGFRSAWLSSLVEDVSVWLEEGKEVAIVSSGAIALGRQKLFLKHLRRLSLKQAAAAAGQPLLMRAWDEAFAQFGLPTAQLLLTLDDTESRRRWLNARATMEVLLGNGAVPIVNENDSVATEELRYGDNDRLSARVAQMIQAELLILLSDVDGFYSGDPRRDRAARHVPHVGAITGEIEAWAGGPSGVGLGTGGMRTKIAAAAIAQRFGCATIIASGQENHPLAALRSGGRATVIDAKGSPKRAYKQWIAGTLVPAGSVRVDSGAVAALSAGKSLLPAGVTAVDGNFERGVCLRVLAPDGEEVARGISAYTSAETQRMLGCATSEIEARLGYSGPDELIHRNDLVLM